MAKLIEHRNPFVHDFITDSRASDHVRGTQELVGVLALASGFYIPASAIPQPLIYGTTTKESAAAS